MPVLLSTVSSLVLALFWASAATAQDSCAVCEDVHFFLARGNNEPYPGRQGQLVADTCSGLSSCGYEDLIFSDLYTDLYCQIAYDAAIAGLTQMKAYAEKCPDSKLILAGYSSGGNAATDILAGGGGTLFNGCVQPDTPPLDSSIGDKIAAVMIVGDVRHTANQSYNFGTGSPYDGWFPRTKEMLANLDNYAPIMRNWCVDTDPICAAHLPNYDEESHLDYYDLDSQAMASFIKSVASLTDNSDFTTAIPTSISGTVQDYATIGTATPSGSVTLDTTWTSSSTYAPCTATSYSQYSASANATANATMSSSSSAGSSSKDSTTTFKTPTAAVVSKTTPTGGSSPSSTQNAAAAMSAVGSSLPAVGAILALMFM